MCYNQKLPSSMKQNPYPIGFLCTYMYLIKIDSLKGRLIYHTWIHRSIMGVAALSSEVVQVTESCGAIRHGAECFNFYFPQANVVSHVVSHFVVWVNCRSLGGWYSNPTLLNDWYWLPIILGSICNATWKDIFRLPRTLPSLTLCLLFHVVSMLCHVSRESIYKM